MDDFIKNHAKQTQLQERDLYKEAVQTTIERRLYLGNSQQSQMLSLKENPWQIWPLVASLWVFGISLTVTYPASVKIVRKVIPSYTRGFWSTHIAIFPIMFTINTHLAGILKGLCFVYWDKQLSLNEKGSL